MIYDVAIVGAGPAGTSAALELEKHFDSVLLLEKEEFPRRKLCAGVLPPRIHSLVDIPEEIKLRGLEGYRIFSPTGRTLESQFPREGVMVEREAFDEFLLSLCKTKPTYDRITGVGIEDEHVALTGEKGSFQAKMVIGADGVGSVIRMDMDIHMDKIAIAVQLDISLPEEVITERIGGWFEVYYLLHQGYGPLAPMKDLVKVGMGGTGEEFKMAPQEHLHSFFKHLKEKIGDGEKGPIQHWRIPMGGPLKRLTGDRCILVGDAGGFVFPGTGEGVYYGMKSGILAAETVKEAFEQNKFDQNSLQEAYSKKLEENGLLSLRDIAFIEEVLATDKTAEAYIRRLSLLDMNK